MVFVKSDCIEVVVVCATTINNEIKRLNWVK